GVPVVWADLDPLARLTLKDPKDAERRALGKMGAAFDLALQLKPPRQTSRRTDETALAVRGVFRGRRLEMPPPGVLCNLPDYYVDQYRQPAGAHIAVQAEPDVLNAFAAEYEQMMIVLDYSGSMGFKVKGSNETRKDKMLAALRTCLEKVPDGVRLGV